MKVKAIANGFYGGQQKAVGDEFEIASDEELGLWMEKVDAPEVKPEKKPK